MWTCVRRHVHSHVCKRLCGHAWLTSSLPNVACIASFSTSLCICFHLCPHTRPYTRLRTHSWHMPDNLCVRVSMFTHLCIFLCCIYLYTSISRGLHLLCICKPTHASFCPAPPGPMCMSECKPRVYRTCLRHCIVLCEHFCTGGADAFFSASFAAWGAKMVRYVTLAKMVTCAICLFCCVHTDGAMSCRHVRRHVCRQVCRHVRR